jgi:hypothetical protein
MTHASEEGQPDEVLGQHGLFELEIPVLRKPFTPVALLDQVRQLLAGP